VARAGGGDRRVRVSATRGKSEQAPAIFDWLIAACVEAERKGNQATLDQLSWFVRTCDEEFDEACKPRRRQYTGFLCSAFAPICGSPVAISFLPLLTGKVAFPTAF